MQLYTGCVENRQDPLKLGRCQVRVVGLHHHDKSKLKTEDLPWAYPMQPITSAAISGIGHSPVGPVEGTWVVVMFRDDDEQQPIILGSIGGIPQTPGSIDEDNDELVIREPDNSNWRTGGGSIGGLSSSFTNSIGDIVKNVNSAVNTATSAVNNVVNTATSIADKATSVVNNGLNSAKLLGASTDSTDLIKSAVGLSTTAYKNAAGQFAIGYGQTSINGVPVTAGQTITAATAENSLDAQITDVIAPVIAESVKAPITQSTYDSLVSFIHDKGVDAFKQSELLTELNASKQVDAATLFSNYIKTDAGVVDPDILKRRIAEKDLFLKDGVADATGNLSPFTTANGVVGSAQNPSGLTNFGSASTIGFKDPKGKYPLFINEPDTNKLARNEDIKKTIVYKKELARDKNVFTYGVKKWTQPEIPYNTKYPFNHVYQSESGHVMEFDDTKGSERVHIYHKAGTYTEIDANGTQVNRIVGDKYEILERNGHVHVKGSLDVTIDGESNVLVKNAMNVEVQGDVNMKVSGDMNVAVLGTYNLKATNINLESINSMDLYSTRTINVQSTTSTNIRAFTSVNIDGLRVDLNDNKAGLAAVTGLVMPIIVVPKMPTFSKLNLITRATEAAGFYETPDEGDAADYIAKRIADGTLDPSEVGSGTVQGATTPPANTKQPLPQSCNAISTIDKFSADLQLSPHFTLGSLTSNGTRMPVDQMGLTAQQIVCNLKGLAESCLEPILNLYPGMIITSGFRRPNDVANSSATSQHYNGEAADIQIQGFDREKHYEAIQTIQQLVPYDQLILEYSGTDTVWIHISFKYVSPRKQAFTMQDHSLSGSMGQFTLIT
jgi:GH24 family phage-related lysozyme (muramidase)/uncharacterized protein YcbK (DUF882 family)